MTVESKFLIRFGLHHFVSHSKDDGTARFVVDGSEGQTMIAHAKNIIEEMYGAPSIVSVR